MRDDILLRYAKEVARDYERNAEQQRLAQLALGLPLWKRTLYEIGLVTHIASLLEWFRGS